MSIDDLKVLMELQWPPMPGLQQGVHTTHARRDGVARVLEHLDEFGGIRFIEAEGWKRNAQSSNRLVQAIEQRYANATDVVVELLAVRADTP